MKCIGIACDHGGYDLKVALVRSLQDRHSELTFLDFGTNDNQSVDYPDYAKALCDAILDGRISEGILICGSGIGVSMTANRYQGIRAALVYDKELAGLAKAHNNANVLCLGGRFTSLTKALKIVETWMNTEFEGDRHIGRLEKMDQVTSTSTAS